MPNVWLERRVIAYAHQGGAAEGPSSTLYAMRRALAAGASAVELDVHATSDGHLVVCHDPTVDRTTNGSGAISEMTLEEVQSLDNAYWFVPGEGVLADRDPGEYALRGRAPGDPELRIATLEEVLQSFPGVVLNLDIKQSAPTVTPYEAKLAELLSEHERRDDVIVASFIDSAVAAFSELSPDVATAAGTNAVAAFWRSVNRREERPEITCDALQVPPDFRGVPIIDEAFMTAAHQAGVAVHVWTIDEADEMARLVGLGVDGIISDRPSVLVTELDRLGASWKAA